MRAWWAGLARADRVLVGLVGAVLAVKVVVYLGMAGAPIYGDEAYYVDAGRALSNLARDLVSLDGPDEAELGRNVVGNGWFMPGMSIVLSPLFLVAPDAPVWLVRGWLGLCSTGLLLTAVLVVRRTLGALPAGAVLVFPGLVPMYALFGMAAYGDQAAGLVVVVMLCRLLLLLREARAGRLPTLRQGVSLGVLAIVAVYLRSSVIILVAGLLVMGLIVALLSVVGRDRLRVLATFAAAGAAAVALLLPWSLAASDALGGRVVTTTSVPIVLANTFGDREEICFGACDPGSTIWFSPLRYSREVARVTDLSEMDAASEMSAYALRDVTPQSYARSVGVNLGRYVGRPAHFVILLRWEEAPVGIVWFSRILTWLLFFPALAVCLAMLLVVVRRRHDDQVQGLLLKLTIGALLVQPFVHISGSRYWTTLAPFLGLSAAFLIQFHRRGRDEPDPSVDQPAETRWLTVLHGVASAAVVLIATAIGVLAI